MVSFHPQHRRHIMYQLIVTEGQRDSLRQQQVPQPSARCPRSSSSLVSVHSHVHTLSNSYSLHDPASTIPVHEVGFWSAVIHDVSACLFLLHFFFIFCLTSFSSMCLVIVSNMSIVLQDRWQLGFNVASQLESVPTWPWTGTPGVMSWSWSTTSWYTSHLVTPQRKMEVHHRSTSDLFKTNYFCVLEKRNETLMVP